MENKPLTAKQEAFCRHYVANGFNATQAAKSAGYSEDTAQAIGAENLTKPLVSARISELTKGTAERAKKGADDVYQMAADAAFFDIGEVLEMDETGVYLQRGMKLSDVDPRLRRLIQSVKSKPSNFGVVNEIIFVDKLKALEMLARFNGMNKDTLKVTNTYETKTDEDIENELKELEGK